MAKKLKIGDEIRGYEITKVFGPGMMAISYAAVDPSGRKVFFKQYKSPAPSVVWYRPFVEYQKELSARVRSGLAGHFAVKQTDAFEELWGGPCYFQAYEFVEKGADLQQILDDERDKHQRTQTQPAYDPSVWARHVTWAKVLVSGIAALHESKIVHADLKPANAYLIQDSTIGSGYQLKLIDMDFSLLTDRRAPWHGYQAYIGTDNYRSPEHLVRGAIPGPASDIFTCGLILYELLAGFHPYWQEDQSDYAKLVHRHAAKPPALIGTMPAPASNAEVSSVLHRCLSTAPTSRPTAAELRAILSGRGTTSATKAGSASSHVEKSSKISTTPQIKAKPPIISDGLELLGPEGGSLKIRIRTELGKELVRNLGPGGEFWDTRQCLVEPNSARQWIISPLPDAINETLVNGVTLTTPRELRQGDSIAVGRQEKGLLKLPLVVRGI